MGEVLDIRAVIIRRHLRKLEDLIERAEQAGGFADPNLHAHMQQTLKSGREALARLETTPWKRMR